MQTIALLPRTATEIVDATFRLCRAHYGTLIAATLLITGPALLLEVLLPARVAGLAGILKNLLLPVTDGAVIAIVSDAYLRGDADIGRALGAVRGRIGALIMAWIARSALFFVGLLLFIVPGVMMVVATMAVPMAIVLERRTIGASFGRARELAEEQIGHILATMTLLVIIVFALMIGLAVTLAFASKLLTTDDRSLSVIADVTLMLFSPVYSVGATVLYYDLRIRKEGFDLEMMTQELGGEMPAGVATSPTG